MCYYRDDVIQAQKLANVQEQLSEARHHQQQLQQQLAEAAARADDAEAKSEEVRQRLELHMRHERQLLVFFKGGKVLVMKGLLGSSSGLEFRALSADQASCNV